MNTHILLKDEKQIAAVESIKRVDEQGYLYYMESNWDYYEIPEAFLPLFNAGCSTFLSKNLETDWLLYRNFDYRHWVNNVKDGELTGLNIVCRSTNPKARFKSIGVADAYWLDFKNGSYGKGTCDDGKTDLSAFAMIPYLCMDGMNEAGLAVSIMALLVKADWKEIDYTTWKDKVTPGKENFVLEKVGELPDEWAKKCDVGSIAYNDIDKKAWICEKEWVKTNKPNQKAVLHPILMRMMLDNCSCVEEAIGMANMFNVTTPQAGMDFHIMIADKSGNCKVLEWIEGEMKIVDSNHSTNYRFSADDSFHGVCPRDEILKASLNRWKNGMREDYGELTMRLASQDPKDGNLTGKTQYSCIYNLQKKTLKVYSYGDFEHSWTYTL